MGIRVMILEKQDLMGEIVQVLLTEASGISLGYRANTWNSCARQLKKDPPDVLLIDIFQFDQGSELIPLLKKMNGKMKILIFTLCKDKRLIVKALNEGAEGYLAKDAEHFRMEEGIRRLYEGEDYIFPPISELMERDMEYVKKALGESKKINQLTKRERQVMELIGKGYSNLQIAQELFISDKTVKNHVSNVLKKMNLNDRTQVAVFFLNNTI